MKRWGILFQPGALWIGAHYSRFDRRWCIGVPMLTLWITLKGGRPPKAVRDVPDEQFVKTEHIQRASAVGKYKSRLARAMEQDRLALQGDWDRIREDGARAWRAECDRVARGLE